MSAEAALRRAQLRVADLEQTVRRLEEELARALAEIDRLEGRES